MYIKIIKYILGVAILVAFMSCGKEDNENENIFEFNLNNSYRIESTGVGFGTSNAFEPENNIEISKTAFDRIRATNKLLDIPIESNGS